MLFVFIGDKLKAHVALCKVRACFYGALLSCNEGKWRMDVVEVLKNPRPMAKRSSSHEHLHQQGSDENWLTLRATVKLVPLRVKEMPVLNNVHLRMHTSQLSQMHTMKKLQFQRSCLTYPFHRSCCHTCHDDGYPVQFHHPS